MSGTIAVPLDGLASANRTSTTGQPLCPACHVGRLHPYRVEVGLPGGDSGWNGADFLVGWVLVCVGDADHRRALRELREAAGEPVADDDGPGFPPCGFVMGAQPGRRSA